MSGAVAAYSKAVALDPYRPEALAHLGTAYMRQGNYEAAVSVLSELLGLEPDDVPTLVNLARTLAGMQRPCEAAPLLTKARGLDANPSRQAQLDLALSDLSEKCARSRAPAH
jgi:cytochrome c-type biogenesis protein CcmH/NrfG